MLTKSIAFILLILFIVSRADAQFKFQEHTLATDLRGGYQVVVADLNRDGKLDLIALASGMKELVWFENPGWQRHVIINNASRMINCAAYDVDGDGFPEIALAQEFANNPAQSIGIVSILKHKGDPAALWEATEIDRLPTSHRLRWANIDGSGKKVLVNAPLANAYAQPPEYNGNVPLVIYRPGSWKREIISTALAGVLHGVAILDLENDGREDILTASFVGVDAFRFGKDGKWLRNKLVKGDPAPWPKSGASEIAVGMLNRERFLSTIEAWHGNQVVVYRFGKTDWERLVIDDKLNDGHTLLTADLNGDGRDEIIAGYRGEGRSVNLYSFNPKSKTWVKQVLDNGGIAAAACAVADLNGDGKFDVACIGSATTNLKWYENQGQRK
ncbi:MAG: VCBS repeat-containing protein [Blastocatellia bacterium]|nr:VCBS repeat-containing protein [Blastocatellia bacterium]